LLRQPHGFEGFGSAPVSDSPSVGLWPRAPEARHEHPLHLEQRNARRRDEPVWPAIVDVSKSVLSAVAAVPSAPPSWTWVPASCQAALWPSTSAPGT